MIRKWFIIGVLALMTLYMMWGFLSKAVLYDPVDEIQRSAETESTEKKIVTTEFAHAWSSDILRKNLFSPSRYGQVPQPRPRVVRREEPEPPPPPPPPPPRPDVVLSAIIQDIDGEFRALLSINNQEVISLRVGESIEGLTVVDIQDRSVTLNWIGTDEFRLSMQTSKTKRR